MSDLLRAWNDALPDIRESVTGVGVWTALNRCVPVALEEDILVLGLPHHESDLAGHLKLPHIKREIEKRMSSELRLTVKLRVIDGVTADDYERVKRRDLEARRLQEASLARMKAQLGAKTNWDGIYEQLGRRFAAIQNKSQPQSRARFLDEAVEVVAQGRRDHTEWDDLNERNFARCIERVAQYADVPSTSVARMVLQSAGEL